MVCSRVFDAYQRIASLGLYITLYIIEPLTFFILDNNKLLKIKFVPFTTYAERELRRDKLLVAGKSTY